MIGRLLAMLAFQATTWNPGDKNASLTLSASDLQATGAGSGYRGVRATTARAAGKWYFEATNLTTSSLPTIGVAQSNASLTNFIGSDANGFGYSGDGDIYAGGTTILITFDPWTAAGNEVAIAVDLDNRKLWVRNLPSGDWNGSPTANPATNTEGVSITSAVAFFPATAVQNGSSILTNFGATAFTGTPPAGFEPWG